MPEKCLLLFHHECVRTFFYIVAVQLFECLGPILFSWLPTSFFGGTLFISGTPLNPSPLTPSVYHVIPLGLVGAQLFIIPRRGICLLQQRLLGFPIVSHVFVYISMQVGLACKQFTATTGHNISYLFLYIIIHLFIFIFFLYFCDILLMLKLCFSKMKDPGTHELERQSC